MSNEKPEGEKKPYDYEYSFGAEKWADEMDKEPPSPSGEDKPTCPKCGVVPAKGGGCINHDDCPMRPAPPEMTAEEYLKMELDKNVHTPMWQLGEQFRHYANLRAAEAVREFAGELYGESMHKIIKDHMKFNGYFNFPQHAESYITNKLK